MRFLYACIFVFVVKIFFGLHLWTIFINLQLKNNPFPNSAIKFRLWDSYRMSNCTGQPKKNFRIHKNDKRFSPQVPINLYTFHYYYYKVIISIIIKLLLL